MAGRNPEEEAADGEENDMEEDMEEGEVPEENTESQSTQKKGKAKKKQQPVNSDNCLACGKKCTGKQYSVFCTLCEIWCHKDCAGLSDAVFKSLQVQAKEAGIAWWACRSCLNFSRKINTQVKAVTQKMEDMDAKIEENSKNIVKTRKEMDKQDGDMRRIERRVDDVEENVKAFLLEEMREREQRKLNLVIHGVEEPPERMEDNRERAEEDKDACGRIFKAMRVRAMRSSVKFCRRVGKRGRDPRPLVIGLYREGDRADILAKARELQQTRYRDVNIVPDLTRNQRAEEVKMREEADRRNRDLTEEDREKNMKWLVVGKKGEKRLTKGQEREITGHTRRTGDGDREREDQHRTREREGDREGDQDRDRARDGESYRTRDRGDWTRGTGREREREARETGARKKEGGAWSREWRDRRGEDQRGARNQDRENGGRDERREGRDMRQRQQDGNNGTGVRDNIGRRAGEEPSHRYSDWRADRRQETSTQRRTSQESQRSRESVEKSVVELGRGTGRTRVHSKRSRVSDSDSDREADRPRNKATRQ